ncbi:hypothetical protein Tco_0865258 [Tanacetum coccineum]
MYTHSVFIMAQQPRQTYVHQDELCPPNKRYALMDANKKVDLDNPLCPNESKFLANIIQNHHLRFCIAASSSELTLILDDFINIFHLPQANDNNHDHFVPPPKFSEMVSFYKNELGFTLELKTTSNFKTTGLMKPWQTLCKMFSKCLTTRVTGWDQPPLQIMQMVYCFVNNIHVDYAELLWEGFHYSLIHPTTLIPYPRFTKLIVSHYMTTHPDISKRARDRYHNLDDDELVKNIFNSRKHKDKILFKYVLLNKKVVKSLQNVKMVKEHMVAEEIEKLVKGPENVRRTEVDDSTLRQDDTIIDPDTRLEPRSDKESLEVEITGEVTPVNVNEEEEDPVVDGHELKRRAKGKHVEETRNSPTPTPIRSPRNSNLISSDTEKLQELTEYIPTSSSYTPSSAKNCLLSLLKSKTKTRRFARYRTLFAQYGYWFEHLKRTFLPRTKFHELADFLQQVMEDSLPMMVDTRFTKLLKAQVPQERANLQAEISSQINNVITNQIPSQVDASIRSYMSSHVLHVHPVQETLTSVQDQQYQLYLNMKDDPQSQQDDLPIWLALMYKFEKFQVLDTSCRPSAIRTRDQEDPNDDAPLEGEKSAKRQKMSEIEVYVSVESSAGQDNKGDQGQSSLGNQEQHDFDFWTDSYASDDDEILTEQVSQDFMDELSQTIDEARLHKVVNEMLRQQCTSGDEHQYHIDQMHNFLKNDVKKKGSKGPDMIVMSLHKFLVVRFLDDEIKERTSRWVNKCLKKFNPYARYNVEHWKNPQARIFYIKRQQEPRKPKEEIYSNLKIIARRANGSIVLITEADYKNLNKNDIGDMYLLIINNKVPDYAETGLLWSLSVFIRSMVIWERVHDLQLGVESYQHQVNLNAPTITFPGIEEYDMFSIINEPVYGIIYKNSKNEKRVMSHKEIHKFCDATLKRVLEGLKSYNNDVKHEYAKTNLTKEDAKFLQLFICLCLKSSLENIPRSNEVKIKYLSTSESMIQEKLKDSS